MKDSARRPGPGLPRSVQPNPGPDLDSQAAEWVIRLGDPRLDARTARSFHDWLATSPLHREAYDFARATWRQMGALPDAPPDGLPVPMPARGRGWLRQGWRQGWRQGLALACVALLALGGARYWYGDPLLMLRADHVAGHGLRIVDLPDGSRAELGPGSALDVDYDDRQRRVTLLRGKAYFTARPAPDAGGRPFRVQAQDVTVTALGTEFSVAIRHHADAPEDVAVIVTEHRVQVATDGDRQAVVAEGQAVRFSAAQGLSDVRAVDAEFRTAWRQGRLIFDDRPLSFVVAELNRYQRRQIVIRDRAVATRRVSGVFDTADIDSAVARIAEALDLRQMSLPPFVTLLY